MVVLVQFNRFNSQIDYVDKFSCAVVGRRPIFGHLVTHYSQLDVTNMILDFIKN